jgi:hypothetical protein
MTGSLRLTDLVLVLGAIALAVILVGHQSASPAAGPPGPLTISQAVAFYSDGPLVVRGYLVIRPRQALLCERPGCAGPRLSVRGAVDRARAETSAVLALGVVTDRRIALVRLAPAAPSQRL